MRNTSNLKLLKYISSLLIMCLSYSLHGQINLKVGYNLSFTNLEETKAIFDRFNDANPQAEKKLSPAKVYHGIELGLRHKFNQFGVELSLSSTSGSSEALNVIQSNGNLGKDEWRISMVNYALGIENHFGVFGLGANIGIQKLKYRTDFDSSDGKKTIFEESVLSSKFYLILEVPSNKVAFSIRPYISTTWEPYNIYDVELSIDPSSTISDTEFDQNIFMYGISFVFYNGPQNR